MNIIAETKNSAGKVTHRIESAGVLYVATKEDAERAWRDSELLRTDELVKLPDYPVDLTAYRVSLRDYPSQAGFPNGARPTI